MPKYLWVPAGFDTMGQLKRVGIKKVPRVNGRFKMSENGLTVQTEDKIITTDKKKFEKCDTVLKYGAWTPELIAEHNLKLVMFNSATANPKMRPQDFGVDVLTDSGGYQLKTGVKKFLDPAEVARKHNAMGTIGISLDLPVTPGEQTILLDRLAQMQRRNNEVFKKELTISGMNVSHGFDLINRQKYLDQVFDPHFDRLAVAGLIGHPPIDIVAHLFWTHDKYGRGGKIKHYHFLGISGYGIFFTLSYLAKLLGPDVTISSDSTTYLMHSKNMLLFDPLRYSGSLDVSSRKVVLTPSTRLPCTCRHCRDLEYLKAIADGPKGLTICVAHHNMLEATRRVRSVNDMVDAHSSQELANVIKFINPVKAEEINRALRFADMLVQAGPKERQKLLRPWVKTKALFQIKEHANKNVVPKTKSGQRFVNILDAYDAYHSEHGIK
jgi:hypothetical protein